MSYKYRGSVFQTSSQKHFSVKMLIEFVIAIDLCVTRLDPCLANHYGYFQFS